MSDGIRFNTGSARVLLSSMPQSLREHALKELKEIVRDGVRTEFEPLTSEDRDLYALLAWSVMNQSKIPSVILVQEEGILEASRNMASCASYALLHCLRYLEVLLKERAEQGAQPVQILDARG